MKKILGINNQWFFKPAPFLFRLCTIYINGDFLVILPFFVILPFIALWSVRFMWLVLFIFITVRNFGEMIYWLSQQFYVREYRPFDFKLKELDNHAVYIIYQLFSTIWVVIGVSGICYILFFWK